MYAGEGPRGDEDKGRYEIKSRFFHRIVVYTSLVCIYATGVGLRWGIVGCLRDYHGGLPYTLESALLFHYAKAYAVGDPIPAVDKRAQYPEGLEVTRKLSFGKEIVAAVAYRALGGLGSFRDFVRRLDAAWFCLGIFAIFLVVREMGGGHLGGLIAAAFYAVSLPSVIRSTGLEFSRENFALPLIFWHWWLIVRAAKRQKLAFSSVAAGVLLAGAAATWDVTQLYILLLGVFAAFRLLFGKTGDRLLRAFLPGVGFLLVAGLTVPYLRDHGFLFSWGMLVWYSLAAAFLLRALFGMRAPALPKVAFLVVLASLAVLVIGQTAYPGTYSHFARLFLAKLQYLNVKPLDPAKLSYDARILWTPALHSATSRFLGRYPIADFELLLLVGAIPLALLIRSLFKQNASEGEKILLYCLVVFFLLYLLFVRMQVFLVFFLCSLIGLGIRYASHLFRNRTARAATLTAWLLVVFVGLAAETYAYSSFGKIYEKAGTGSPYAANNVLIAWLRKNTEEDAVVLANFTLEPTIFAYAGRAIVLHPKFESPKMRLKVKQYLEALFSKNEEDFHDFCVKNGVNYYVLHPGVFAGPRSKDWVYSHRYMVDRAADRAEARHEYANLAMLDNPDRLQYFKRVTDVSMAGDRLGFFYRVFRVVSEREIELAAQLVRDADAHLGGDVAMSDWESLERAEKELLQAIDLFPGCMEAHARLAAVYSCKHTLRGEEMDRNKASQEVERCKQILADRRE